MGAPASTALGGCRSSVRSEAARDYRHESGLPVGADGPAPPAASSFPFSSVDVDGAADGFGGAGLDSDPDPPRPPGPSTAPGRTAPARPPLAGPPPLDEDDAVLRDRSSSDHVPSCPRSRPRRATAARNSATTVSSRRLVPLAAPARRVDVVDRDGPPRSGGERVRGAGVGQSRAWSATLGRPRLRTVGPRRGGTAARASPVVSMRQASRSDVLGAVW